MARNANDSRLLLGRCYGNERTAAVVLKCCIQGDCSVSVKKKVVFGSAGGWGGGALLLALPFFFFPPPTAATLGHYLERSEERDFSETIREDGSGVMKIVLSLSRFFPTVDVSLASDRRPAIVSFGPIQELLTSSGCTGGDPKAGGRGWGVSEGVSPPPV